MKLLAYPLERRITSMITRQMISRLKFSHHGGQATRHRRLPAPRRRIKGDRLGVVADVHQAVAEISFVAQLIEVDPHQLAASHNHQNSGGPGGVANRDSVRVVLMLQRMRMFSENVSNASNTPSVN